MCSLSLILAHCLKTPEHLSQKPGSFKTTTFVVGPEIAFAADLGVAFVADPEAVSLVVELGVSAAAQIEAVSASVETQVSAAELEAGSVAVDPKTVSVADQSEAFATVALEVVSASVETQVSAVELEAGSVAVDPKIVSVVAQTEAFAVVAPEAVSVDIAFAFVVSALVSVVVAEADSSERPRFLAFPNADHFASSSSSVEVAGEESVHSPIGAHTNYGLCSIPSSLDLHHNRNLE